MTDTSKKAERYHEEIHGMKPGPALYEGQQEWVRVSDYDALADKLDEVTEERDQCEAALTATEEALAACGDAHEKERTRAEAAEAELQSDREAQWAVLDSAWKRRAEKAEAENRERFAATTQALATARAAMVTALGLLDASLFTNAEHSRAKGTLRAAIALIDNTEEGEKPINWRDDPKVKALMEAAEKTLNPEGTSIVYRQLVRQNLRAALAALEADNHRQRGGFKGGV